MGIVRGEHFCDGTILSMSKPGTVLKWFVRLKANIEFKGKEALYENNTTERWADLSIFL